MDSWWEIVFWGFVMLLFNLICLAAVVWLVVTILRAMGVIA